jgi:hypothetical protein
LFLLDPRLYTYTILNEEEINSSNLSQLLAFSLTWQCVGGKGIGATCLRDIFGYRTMINLKLCCTLLMV